MAPDERIRSRAYDALGRLVAATDALGHTQHRRYDRLGQVVALRGADGRETRLAYDAEGNVVRAQDGPQEVAFAYTAVNRLAVRRQAGQEVRLAYDRQARLTGLTNEHGRRYRFALDAAGRVAEETGFDGLTRRYARDAAGRVTQVQRPAGRATTYVYDASGRVTEVAYSDGTYERYAYDAMGAIVTASTPDTTLKAARDPLGRVVMEQQGPHTVACRYDARGQRTGLNSSLGAEFTWQHDAMGNLTTVQAGDVWQAHLLHDVQGLELQRTYSGGVRVGWQHDAAGRPLRQRVAANGTERLRQYTWQASTGYVAEIDDSASGTTRYAYDTTGALTGAYYADGTEELRLTDAVGNLFRSIALQDRQYAHGGQLRRAGGTRYAYDDEGNLVQKTEPNGQEWRYVWNGAGQLTSVTLPSGYAVSFAYDALGRRISKRYRGRVTRWVWDGNRPLHEWTELELGPGENSAGDVITWLFEENSFAPVAKLTAGAAQSVVCDHLGTPLELYDQAGTKTWQAQLDSYGQVRQGKGQAQNCPFRYQGQYEDVETGLYYNRFRYYDPEMGQYISQDPIGLAGGNRLYTYVADPNRLIDPLGLAPWENGGFAAWFDKATPAEILANKSSVSAALRGNGGMHEMFPVSMAAKAKELGFSHAELMDLTKPRDQVWFENVPDGKGNIHDGPHSTGAKLPPGQSSKASSWFHENLGAELQKATTKAEALRVIQTHHDTHVVGCSS